MLSGPAFTMLALVGQIAPSPEVEQELTRIEQQLADTYERGDCDAWGALLAPEWSVIHITGATITKTEAVATCRKPPAPIDAVEHEVLSIRAYGEVAVVTGRTTATAGGQKPVTVTLRFTDVFVRRDGRWQVVASQATRIAP